MHTEKHVLFKNLFQFDCEFKRYMYSSYSNMRKWQGNNTLTHATLLFLWLHFLSKVNQRTKINQRQLFVSLLMLVHKNIQFTENKLTLQTLKLKLKLETFLQFWWIEKQVPKSSHAYCCFFFDQFINKEDIETHHDCNVNPALTATVSIYVTHIFRRARDLYIFLHFLRFRNVITRT